MDLFEYGRQKELEARAPLAARMRPRGLDDYAGQEHLLGPGKFLRRAIESGLLISAIFFGPPGTGKTTLARLWAAATRAHFAPLNAVSAGVAELRREVEAARERLGGHGTRTVLFVDEIHRFNKAQQDALLPYVEDGTVVLMGATVMNPLVYVNSALVSRTRLFELKPLDPAHVRALLQRALRDRERGLGGEHAAVDDAALEHLVRVAGGDARAALGGLELAVLLTPPDAQGVRRVGLAAAEEALQRRAVHYDLDGDEHYHVISAFIKSIRGSDPDAAVYWLARMLHAGEDPRFIARRMVIHAAEDIGLADPQALLVAAAAAQAVDLVGLPEARLPMAEAAIYLAAAPKSNAAYRAINRALEDVARGKAPPVPLHLRDPGYGSGDRLGYGKDYKYPHDYPGHWVRQQYLPDGLEDGRYYQPSQSGAERAVRERLAPLRREEQPGERPQE